MSEYQVIVSAVELNGRLNDPNWVVVDCRHDLTDPARGERDYAAGHIPGAHFLHADRDLAGPHTGQNGRHPLPSKEAFAATLGRIGVDATKQVVAYDAQGGMMAARLWWMLQWVGHNRVAVLDGGLPGWIAAGHVTSTAATTARPTTFVARAGRASVDAQYLLDRLGQPDLTIIDARASDRFRGENETLDPVGGHIPGAINRPFRDNLAADGRFKSAAELATAWRAVLGGKIGDGVVHQCGSGVSACHNMLALAIAGLPQGRLYPGSWSEWCADPSRPVAI
jgi:thiosulfate/3-mercaptopyruvate sulfurtransferase